MFFVYLSLGILLVFILHTMLRWFANAEPTQVRKAFRWVFVAIVVAAIFFLIRFGLLHLAAIVSFLSVVVPLLQRFQSNKGARKDAPHKARMTQEEAREILGVGEGADRKQVLAAHRRMIQKNHPDTGGSEYLASKINEARDVLLDK